MRYATEKVPGLVHRDLKPENVLMGTDRLQGWSVILNSR
jgi:serine/threonine protein kinase